jgi:outer membrane protein OmpA-like peptidoglycan-associated protein
MAIPGSGRQPRDAGAFIQGRLARASVLVTCAVAFTACGDIHDSGPEKWWHEAVGGKIAEQRPPPPGDKDPYPNLASVPSKPKPADAAAWQRMTAGLMSDRLSAHEAAALAPISPPSPAANTTGSPGGGSQSRSASAALAGTSPGTKTPEPSPPTSASVPSGTARPPAPHNIRAPETVAAGQPPPLPGQAPARPSIAPAPPPPATQSVARSPIQTRDSIGDIPVDFTRGSSALSDDALAEVRTLAASHGEHGIGVTGFGDATSSDAHAQAAAVGLGLSRAQALASALVAQGVPLAMLRLNAESAGRGASLRLLQ